MPGSFLSGKIQWHHSQSFMPESQFSIPDWPAPTARGRINWPGRPGFDLMAQEC
jgi:hypothetical protein